MNELFDSELGNVRTPDVVPANRGPRGKVVSRFVARPLLAAASRLVGALGARRDRAHGRFHGIRSSERRAGPARRAKGQPALQQYQCGLKERLNHE